MIRNGKGNSKIELVNDYIVLDIETTGLDPKFDEIIEIGAIKVINGEIVDEFSELVKPSCSITPFISSITGITNEMLENAKNINQVLPRFLDFVKDMTIVGHNVNFDINFIYDYALYISKKIFSNNYIDTLRFSRKLFTNLHDHRLQTISQYLNLQEENYHRASYDCKTTLNIYKYIQQFIIDNNIDILKLFTPKPTEKLKAENIKTENKIFDESHVFYHKNCVFTGSLQISRKEAMQKIVDLGGFCQDNITKDTHFLILGNKDYQSENKSAKHRKAEQFILEGLDIKIISENVFMDLVFQEQEHSQNKTTSVQLISQTAFEKNVDNYILNLNLNFQAPKDFELNETLAFKYSSEATNFEKENKLQEAINLYEKSMYYVFPGNYVYDRLLVLYKKCSQEEKIKNLLEFAIYVFYKLINGNRPDRLPKLKKYYDKYIKLKASL